MTVLIVVGCIVAYVVGWLATARHFHLRLLKMPVCNGPARGKEQYTRSECREYHINECPQPYVLVHGRPIGLAVGATALGLLWPALLPVFVVLGLTPETDAEMERRRAELKKDIKRLERELKDAA